MMVSRVGETVQTAPQRGWPAASGLRLLWTRLSRLRRRPSVPALLALVVLLPLWWAASNLYEERLLTLQRADELANLPPYGHALAEEFEEYASVLTMLKTVITLNTETAGPMRDLDAFGAQTVAGVPGIEGIWLAPQGVVRSVYPLTGNENLLGRNVMDDERPAVRADVAAAIRSHRVTLSNQFDQQANTGDWIAWLAVYNGDSFWGLVALKLDSAHLLQSLDPEGSRQGLEVALRDDSGRLLYGPKAVFENDAVVYNLDRPEPGWELGAVPMGGWMSPLRGQFQVFQIGGLAVVLLLASIIYLNARHQSAENARQVTAAQDAAVLDERHRLAAELHDSVTQLIYSDVLLAEASRNMLASGDLASTDHYLGRIGETAQQALKEMRLLLFELRNSGLAEERLVDALQRRLDAVEKRVGVTVQMRVDPNLGLPRPVEEALFRVATEALNNSLKHAAATSVAIELRREEGDLVEMRIVDDGAGFDPRSAAQSGGLGLMTMRERAERLGGSMMVESAPGAGAVVLVRVNLVQGRIASRNDDHIAAQGVPDQWKPLTSS